MKTFTFNLSARKLQALNERAELMGITPEKLLCDLISEHIQNTVLVIAEDS